MVVGPTRMGKTEWARSLGRHIYMCGLFNLTMWDNEAEYLVLDDISFEFCPSRQSLWGSQKELVLTDKFARKRSVKWGKPLIFLCNHHNDYRFALDKRGNNLLSLSEKEFYEGNSVVVEVRERLY